MKNLAKKFFSMFIVSAVLFSATTFAAAPEAYSFSDPVVSLELTRWVNSFDTSTNQEKTETIGELEISSESLWFDDDPELVTGIITTYDNQGAVKHYKDKVEVFVYQEGQGYSGCYTMINGEQKAISGVVDTIISGYPNPFKIIRKFTITREDVDPDDTCTIFTVGNIGDPPPGVSTSYARHETNLYIYWDTDGQ